MGQQADQEGDGGEGDEVVFVAAEEAGQMAEGHGLPSWDARRPGICPETSAFHGRIRWTSSREREIVPGHE